MQDLRYAFRSLLKSPGFTIVAVLTLALGIGANSAIFSFADATLLRPLPFDEPDRLVTVSESRNQSGGNRAAFLNFADWREQNRTFEAMAAFTGSAATMQAVDGIPEQIPAQSVTVDFFDVLRVRPVIGRTFTATDDLPKPNVVLIGERFWRSRFAGDPQILGRTITLNTQPYTVIGIVPASFQLSQPSEFWYLLSLQPGPYLRRARFLDVIGRLKPGVTLDMARADLKVVSENMARAFPEANKGMTAALTPMRESIVGSELKLTSLVLAGVVACVLLIACANVASLLMARATARSREFAVRAALGAGRRNILTLSLAESLLLATLGGAAGLGLCVAILDAAPTLVPSGLLPPSVLLSVNGRVIIFCAGVTTVVGVFFGLAPAWQATRVSLTEAIGAGTRGSTAKAGAFRTVLATAEVAAAVLLLCGAGLLLRTLTELTSVDPGYRAENILTMRVNLPTTRYNNHERMLGFYQSVERELGAQPGVRAVAFGSALPLDGSFFGNRFEVVGEPVESSQRPTASYHMVSHNYLDTLGISIVQGRGFDRGDTAGAKPVSIVSEAFARQYLKDRNPIGTQIRIGPMSFGSVAPVTREIVGVVRQIKQNPGELLDAAQVYVPIAQNAWFAASIVVQSAAGTPEALLPTLRSAVARVDANLALTRVRTLEDIAREATARPRFRAQLVASFAALALALATIGLFGLLAFSVQQRVQEFGIRMAVGASRADIIRIVLRSTARITLLGIALGLGAAAVLSRSLEGLLFGVKALDVVTFASVAVILLTTAFVASLAPLIRAVRVDPLVALRYE